VRKVLLILLVVPLLGFSLVNLGSKELDKDLVENAGEEVKATKDLGLLGPGGDPSVLYSLAKLGGVVFVDQTTKKLPWIATAGMLVNASPEECFKVATDFTSYTSFMPQVDSVVPSLQGDNIEQVTWTLAFKVAIIPFSLSYSLRYYHRPPYRTDWTAIGGGIKKNNGYYEFVPVKGEKGTIFLNASYSEPRSGFLQWAFKKNPDLELATNLSANLVQVNVIKRRIESLLGREELASDVPKELSIRSMSLDLKTLGDLCSKGVLIIVEKHEEGKPVYVTVGTTFNASIDEVWKQITSYQDYPYYLPMVEKASTVKTYEGGAEVNFRLNMKIVLFEYMLDYNLDNRFEKPNRITWTETKGNIKGVAGSWELVPLGSDKTLGFYRSTSDYRSLGWLVRYMFSQEPTFDDSVQASVGTAMMRNMKRWIEMSEADRDKIRKKEQKIRKEKREDYYKF